MTSRDYERDDYPDPSEFDQHLRPQAEALIAAERRMLAERAAADAGEEECECREGMFPAGSASRRAFLAGAVMSAAVAPAVAYAEAPPGAEEYDVPDDPTKVQGRLTRADGGYGTRSQFETETRWRFPTATRESSWTMTPLEHSQGMVTPSGLHFERHHGGIPTINPAQHTLTVHGMCDRPRRYSMADMKRFPSISRFNFIECSGNGLTEVKQRTLKTVQGTHGLTSTSEWTGIPLSTILEEVGVKDGAAWILAEGADAAVMTRSVPIDKAWGDALLAFAQNGEALRPEQGYPLRLILPGFEGNTHIKWLRRLEISDKPFMTREETSKYTDVVKDGLARQFSFEMEAKSVITFPSGEMKLPGPGFYEITGLAWSGRGRVKQVDVSTDGGRTWTTAQLQTPVMPICHTRFRLPWRWDGKPARIASRCVDETGYVQPTSIELNAARGLHGHPKYGYIYHWNGIQTWAIDAAGNVSNGNEYA
jgi:sulfane dehydrogenase subunit SoxC